MEREIGILICKSHSGKLSARPPAHGDRDSVKVPVNCPLGADPLALWHTHPSGSLRLSSTDIQTGKDHRIPYICVSNGKQGSTRCYRVRRD